VDYPLCTTTLRSKRSDGKRKTALVSSSLLSNVVPPHPIPNWEVKRVSANNSCFARNREDRSRLGDSGAVFCGHRDNI